MGCRRAPTARKALPAWGALCAVLFLLALLFSLLQTCPAQAQSQDEDVWFTVMFQEGGSFNVTADGEDFYLQFDFIDYLDPIKIYKDGTARGEFELPGGASSPGTTIEGTCSFEGQYNSNTQTLTGKYKSSYSRNDEDYQTEYTEEFTGTLEGTLEYRPQQYSGEELVDTIFTMRGKISCTGTAEMSDNDGNDEDESYRKSVKIDYDFVANGNTGPETGKIQTGAEDGEGSKIPGPGSWWVWVTTVVAGGIAAGTGLISSIIGAGAGTVPPAPVVPPSPPQKPGPPPADVPPQEQPQPSTGIPEWFVWHTIIRANEELAKMPPQPQPPPALIRPKPYREAPDGELIYPPGTEPVPTDVDIAIDGINNTVEDITKWEHITEPQSFITERLGQAGQEIIDKAKENATIKEGIDRITYETDILKDALQRTQKDIDNIISIPSNEAYVAWENIKAYIRQSERIQTLKEGLERAGQELKEGAEIFKEGMRMTGEDIDHLIDLPGKKIDEGMGKAREETKKFFKPPEEGQ